MFVFELILQHLSVSCSLRSWFGCHNKFLVRNPTEGSPLCMTGMSQLLGIPQVDMGQVLNVRKQSDVVLIRALAGVPFICGVVKTRGP